MNESFSTFGVIASSWRDYKKYWQLCVIAGLLFGGVHVAKYYWKGEARSLVVNQATIDQWSQVRSFQQVVDLVMSNAQPATMPEMPNKAGLVMGLLISIIGALVWFRLARLSLGMARGSLRYDGFSGAMKAFFDKGDLSEVRVLGLFIVAVFCVAVCLIAMIAGYGLVAATVAHYSGPWFNQVFQLALGLLLAFIVALTMFYYFTFLVLCLLDKKCGIIDALQCSKSLVKGSIIKIVSVTFLTLGIAMLAGLIMGAVIFLGSSATGLSYMYMGHAGALVSSMTIVPFTILLWSHLYVALGAKR